MATITCTMIQGTTVTAQATANSTVTWGLDVTPQGGGMDQILPASNMGNDGTKCWANWTSVPAGSYTVMISEDGVRGVSQPVPFGTCS